MPHANLAERPEHSLLIPNERYADCFSPLESACSQCWQIAPLHKAFAVMSSVVSWCRSTADGSVHHRLNQFRRDGIRIAEMCARDIAGRFAGQPLTAQCRLRCGDGLVDPTTVRLRTHPAALTMSSE
jgi:hypothetical protein